MTDACQTCGSPSNLGCACIRAFVDLSELDTDTVRDIVVQSGCEWPADDSRESRLFRFRVRRIATEAFRRGFSSANQINAIVERLNHD